MTITFRLEGPSFTALNLVVHCDAQAEVDYLWDRLAKGGDPHAPHCGWLKNKLGLPGRSCTGGACMVARRPLPKPLR